MTEPARQRYKYTPDTIKTILGALSVGASITDAAASAGIARDTYYLWLKEYPDFAEQVELAQVKRKIMWLARMEAAAANGAWQAAAWKLERLYPDEFGRKLLEVSGRDGKPVAIEISTARERLAKKLAATFDTDAASDVVTEPHG